MTPKTTGDISVIASYRPTEGTQCLQPVLSPKDCCPEFLPTPCWRSSVEVLTAADVVLSVPAALPILGPDVARQALEFIPDGTIRANPVDKILLDGEPLSPAVDTIRRAVEEVSRNTWPTAVVAASPSTTTTGAQRLA
uniref:Uncharacterized protein n=1 Tax=Romanomermis culicivorax TaxID=13658 RepID=A0A915K794_ROMCU